MTHRKPQQSAALPPGAEPATEDQIAHQLVQVVTRIHAAMDAEAEATQAERRAAVQRAGARTERERQQNQAAQLLAALGFGPNFPTILAQYMRDQA